MERIDVGQVLEQIKEYAMQLIDKRFYLHVRSDEDEPYRVQSYRMRNVRCQNLAETMPHGLSSISMDAEYVLRGCLRHDDVGKKVSVDENDSEKRLNGEVVPITESEKEIQALFQKIYELTSLIKGKQAVFIMKDELSEKYQPVVMDISGVSILTHAIVPGRDFYDSHGGIFVSGIDAIGCMKEQYGEGCFYDLTEAMREAKRRNHEDEKRKLDQIRAARALEQQMITNVSDNELDAHLRRLLIAAGFESVGDITALTKTEVGYIYGIGKSRREKIFKFIESRGLKFKEER